MGSYSRTLISLGLSVWLWSVKSLRIKLCLHFSNKNLLGAYPGTLGHSFKKGTSLRPPPGGGVGGGVVTGSKEGGEGPTIMLSQV